MSPISLSTNLSRVSVSGQFKISAAVFPSRRVRLVITSDVAADSFVALDVRDARTYLLSYRDTLILENPDCWQGDVWVVGIPYGNWYIGEETQI